MSLPQAQPAAQQQPSGALLQVVFVLAATPTTTSSSSGDGQDEELFSAWDDDGTPHDLSRMAVPRNLLLAASEKLAAQVKYSSQQAQLLELCLDSKSQLPAAEYMIQYATQQQQQQTPVSQLSQLFLLDLLLLADKHGFLELVHEVQGALLQQLQIEDLEHGMAAAMCKLCPLPSAAWQLILAVVQRLLAQHSSSSIIETVTTASQQQQQQQQQLAGVQLAVEQASLLLAQVFDDLEQVWSEQSSSRRVMLCNLPLQQLQLLLALGEVGVAHEDTVLYTLASNINVTSTPTQQLRQLMVAGVVRLAHLTPEALLLLPKLAWSAYSAEDCSAAIYSQYMASRGVWLTLDAGHDQRQRRPRSWMDSVTLEFTAPIAQVVATTEQALSQGRDMVLEAATTVAEEEGATIKPGFAGRSWQARFIVYQLQQSPRLFALGLEVRPAFPAAGSVLWCPAHSGIIVECRGTFTTADGPWVHSDYELLRILPEVCFATATELASKLGPQQQQLLVASLYVPAPSSWQ